MKQPMTPETAYSRLSARCAQAEQCSHDMLRLMQRWELTEQQQAEVMARLLREGFINEVRYAHAFVRDKFRYNHWGAARIRQELRIRNIDDNTIEDALTEITDDDNLAQLRQLISRKRPTVKAKSEYELRCKLIRFAMGRGFSYSDITKVIDTDGVDIDEDNQ